MLEKHGSPRNKITRRFRDLISREFSPCIKRIFFSIIPSNEIIEITKNLTANGMAYILNQPDIAFKSISITGYALSFICLLRTVLTCGKGIGGVAI